ncbi:MAG: RHS repeat-associated core domain-containing protein, partial [Limisphaerales bacterium]
PLRFSTQFADDWTGDLKYLHRDYRSDLGRWLSRDPIGERGGVNLLAFCVNNPVGRFDVDGRLTDEGLGARCDYPHLTQTPGGGMIMPASLLSLIDWWASLGMGGFGGYVNWRVTELDEVDWFQNSPGAEGATRRALEHFKRALNNSAELLCQNKCPIISSFYTGSGEVSFQDL